MGSRLDLNRKDPWAESPAKPERPWRCDKCGIGLDAVSATRAKEHIRKCKGQEVSA